MPWHKNSRAMSKKHFRPRNSDGEQSNSNLLDILDKKNAIGAFKPWRQSLVCWFDSARFGAGLMYCDVPLHICPSPFNQDLCWLIPVPSPAAKPNCTQKNKFCKDGGVPWQPSLSRLKVDHFEHLVLQSRKTTITQLRRKIPSRRKGQTLTN